MSDRLSHTNEFFSKSWRIMAFQPVLSFFIFGVTIRLWFNQTEPPNLKDHVSENFYGIWLLLGAFSPILLLCAWLLIKRTSGRWIFVGTWLRLAADIGIFTNVITYHLVSLDGRTESILYSRYIIGSVLFFCVMIIVRDIWTIIATEKLATQIHSESNQ